MIEQQGTAKRYFLSNLTFWRWCVALPLTIILIGIALSLPFGNPQWSKWHYFFQWKTYPGKKPKIPKEYNGRWVMWHENGKPGLEGTIVDGKLHGSYIIWYQSGKVMEKANFKNGIPHGRGKKWDENGKLLVNLNYQNGNFGDGKMIVGNELFVYLKNEIIFKHTIPKGMTLDILPNDLNELKKHLSKLKKEGKIPND